MFYKFRTVRPYRNTSGIVSPYKNNGNEIVWAVKNKQERIVQEGVVQEEIVQAGSHLATSIKFITLQRKKQQMYCYINNEINK
jgi:hypothetical protein